MLDLVSLLATLFREYAGTKKKRFKPVVISHHMIMGLKEGQEKMSKSDVGSAIFMEDTEAEVKTKIKKAYCPPEIVEGNPVIDYAKHIVIGYRGHINITDNNNKVCPSSNLLIDSFILMYIYTVGCYNVQ